jgi:hypothetical protein
MRPAGPYQQAALTLFGVTEEVLPMDMMRNCMNWMMSLGWVAMVLGIILLAALIVLVVALIARMGRGPHH